MGTITLHLDNRYIYTERDSSFPNLLLTLDYGISQQQWHHLVTSVVNYPGGKFRLTFSFPITFPLIF